MHHRFFAVVFCLWLSSSLFAADDSHPNWGQRKTISFAESASQFHSPDRAYAPFIFWFWDEPLNASKMAEMSRVMSSQGFNPGYAHARHPMVGTPDLTDEQWLGDRWFEAFSAALKQAKSQKSYLGYCDEYWWPSFQGNGRILAKHPELQAESLNWQTIDAVGGSEVVVPKSFFAVAAELVNPVLKAPMPSVTLGKWIWDSRGSETEHSCWLRKSFVLPEGRKATKAILKLTADNRYVLFLNGKKIGASDNWKIPSEYDVTVDLVPGRNVLAVEAGNLDGPYGLIIGLGIVLDNGGAMNVATDDSWKTNLERAAGWERPEFDDESWPKAKAICGNGEGPWGKVGGDLAYLHSVIRSNTLRVIGEGASFTWKVPAGKSWRIYAFDKYFHPGMDGGRTNSIDPHLAKAFIDIALEPYAKRLGEKLGKSIPGDFIDNEGDYGWQLAWSDALCEKYKERYNRDIRAWMPLMLDRDEEGQFAKARWEWYDLVSDIYTDNFRAVTDWHESRGMYTTAHVWEESLSAQVNCVGDHMKFLRAVTMPAQDCLGRKCLDVHDFKEISSVAEFQGTRAATELMGVAGWQGLDPRFLKQSVNTVTAWGMGHIIPHGVFTARKLDGNPWMPDFYSDSPTFPWMHLWNEFSERACYINSLGNVAPEVLLYNPLESVWTLTSADMLDSTLFPTPETQPEGRQGFFIDRQYNKAMNDLTEARIEYLVGDRHYLAEMTVKNGSLTRGPFTFRTLVLPPLNILSLDIARKMLAFAKDGGRVYALGDLPSASVEKGMNDVEMIAIIKELSSQPTFTSCEREPANAVSEWTYEFNWRYKSDASKFGLKPLIERQAAGLVSPVKFLSGGFLMLQTRRKIDGRDFFWLTNNDSEKSQMCEIEISGAHGAASIWDCETGEVRPIPSHDTPVGSRVTLAFKPLEAYWLVFDPKQTALSKSDVKNQEKAIASLDGPWTLTYDPSIQPTMEHPVKPPTEFLAGTKKPLEDWKSMGLKGFSGLLDYTTTVTVSKVEGRAILDLGKVFSAAEVWVNDKPCGQRLWGPYVFDVSAALKQGENRIRIRVANLPCASYGIEYEQGLRGPVKLFSGKPIP
jgi:hypothetical protein